MAASPAVVVAGDTPQAATAAAALEDAGMDTVHATDVGTLTEHLAVEEPSCVVCIDGLDGWSPLEVLAVVRDRDPTVPAVVVPRGDPGRLRDLLSDGPATVVDGEQSGDLLDAVAEYLDGDGAGTDQAVETQRDRFATLFDQIPDPVVITRPNDDRIIVQMVNPAFEETFGYTEDQLRGEPIDEYIFPTEAEDTTVVDLDDVETGEVLEQEVTRTTDDGEHRDFLFRGVRANIGGSLEGFGIYTDITERQRHARRVNALHGTSRDLFGAGSVTGVCERAVQAAADILDLPATGIHLAGGVHPDATGDRAEGLVPVAFSRETRTLFAGAPPTYTTEDEEIWSVYRSGEPTIVEDVQAEGVETTAPVTSVMMLPLGRHGVFISSAPGIREFSDEDVDLARLLAANTEAALDGAAQAAALRERESALMDERDRLAALFENVPIPAANIRYRDGEPIVRDVNPEFEEVFGYPAETLDGENLDDYLVPHDHADDAEAYNRRVIDGEVLETEVQRETVEGLRDFLLTVAPVDPETQGGTIYAFYIDITERKQRQQRLRVLSRVLRHDIRNQMNLIDGSATLIADRTDDPGVIEPTDRIRQASSDLLSLSRKTRAVERTVAAADASSEVDLVPAMETLLARFRDEHPDADVAGRLPQRAVVRATGAVTVVLEEVLQNALEHNDDPSPTVEVSFEPVSGGEYLEIRIADDGPGIPADERALISGIREQTQLEHASGIGLWMVNWVVTGLGGELHFEDNEPRGSVVRIRLGLVDFEPA